MFKKILISSTLLTVMVTNVLAAPAAYNEITSDANHFTGKVGIYGKNLQNGKTFQYNSDDFFPTASTSKLVVALAVYKYLYPSATVDKRNLYDSDIEYMMTVSDNASFDELLNEIASQKPGALLQVTKDLRLKKTWVHNDDAFKRFGYHSVTTAGEMAKVFESLYSDRYIGPTKSEEMKTDLANSIFHDEIPRYMQTRVMHKVGELDKILCDVGVVDDGKDQILMSIYTSTDLPAEYASDYIATTSAKLYNALRRK